MSVNGDRGTGAVDRSPSKPVDVCVIGSGPAGALIANELSKKGYDVVVLEAGPRFSFESRPERMERAIRPSHSNDAVWDMGGARDAFSSSGEFYYPLNAARAKGVGGSTLRWQGMVMRLHVADFKRRTSEGVGRNWPLSYDDLRPYYARAERELGVAGAADNPFAPPREKPFPLPAFPPSHSDSIFAEACERLGVTTHSVGNARNSEPNDGRSACVGYGTCQPVCPSGAKYDASTHARKGEERGARVIDRAPVQSLETNSSGTRVERAVYATPDGEHSQEARQFVVACGGVETPRLLLLSESENHPNGLANSSGLVGRYFMDHLFAGMGGTVDRETRQNHIGFMTSETHQFYDTPEKGTSATGGKIPDREGDFGPIKLEFLNYAGPSPVGSALVSNEWGDDLLDSLKAEYGTHIGMGGLVGQLPRAENRVTLDRSTTDDHGNPVPDIQWSIDDRTKRTLKRANEIQQAILEELGTEISWTVSPENTGPAYHHMGTTRMGTDPATSVVDARLRTHDVSNLTIASSSVFPTSGAMNPTLTIAALALKAARHLDRDL